MAFSYNRLWKLLIDRKMSRTEMRKQAGISTNILAKMGKTSRCQWTALQKYVLRWVALLTI